MHTCALLYVISLRVQAFSAASGARRAPTSPGANAGTKASCAVVAPTAIPYSFPSHAQESFRHQGDCQARGRPSLDRLASAQSPDSVAGLREGRDQYPPHCRGAGLPAQFRSEEHTSELQSPMYLVCRLLLEKKKST